MKKDFLKIPKEVLTYLQGAQYDKDNLEFLLSKLSLSNISVEDMNYWKDQYLEVAGKLRFIKDQVTNEFILSQPQYKNCDRKTLYWKADFEKEHLEITYEEVAE